MNTEAVMGKHYKKIAIGDEITGLHEVFCTMQKTNLPKSLITKLMIRAKGGCHLPQSKIMAYHRSVAYSDAYK
jgi:hypothetical protein